MSTVSPSDAPMKRRRGRPRKDDSQTQAVEKSSPAFRPIIRPLDTCTQGEASSAASKGKGTVQVDADVSTDDDYNNDEMVGQVVTGVLECAFDAGYFLRVQVGNSNMYMRGVVFKDGCVVPITPENDIAPYAKMYTRRDLPIPTSFTPQVAIDANTQHHHQQQQEPLSLDVNVGQEETDTEKVVNLSNVAPEKQDDQDQKDPEASEPAQNGDQIALGEENALNQPEAEKTETDLSNEPSQAVFGEINVSNQLKEEKDDTEPSTEVKQKEDSCTRADLEDFSEPPVKIQKTDEVTVTVTCSNGQSLKQPLESEALIQHESNVSVKEINCNSGFQMNMETTDAADLLTEPPSEFSAMETE